MSRLNLSTVITVKVTEKQTQWLEKLAIANQTTKSAIMRQLIQKSIENEKS